MRKYWVLFALMAVANDANADVWRSIASEVTMLAMILFINLLFFAVLLIGVVVHSSKLKSVTEMHALDAQHDFLTNVLNRRGFEITLNALDAREGYLLIVDIDDFKKINDSFGHPVGDRVLREVAEVLKRSLREHDLIARLGGEEFIIFMGTRDVKEVNIISNRLITSVNNHAFTVTNEQTPLSVTVSIGVSRINLIESDLDTSYKAADHNLYIAKQHGKNRYVMC